MAALLAALLPTVLLAQAQLHAPVSVGCPSGDCRLKPTCWTVKAAAIALLNLQCRLADCESTAASAVSGPMASPALLQRLFAYVDTNGDGLATQSELLAALSSLSSSSPSSSGSATAVCTDVLLGRGEGDDEGSQDSGVGKRRFAAMLGIQTAKNADKDSSQDEVMTSLEEGSEIQLSTPVDLDFRMRCPLTTVGKTEGIQWRRHGMSLSSTVGHRRFSWLSRTADTLVLMAVTPADAGIYQCCSSVWRRLCLTLALSVVDHPRVRVHPPMQVRRVGEPALLYCRVEGAPVDQLHWLFNSEPVEHRPGLAFVGVATDIGSTLSIAKLGKHHTGLYTCSVGNRAGMAESAGSVYVRDATETDYSSYQLSPHIWTTAGPMPTTAVMFHSDGYAILDVADCAVKRPVSAQLCGCSSSDKLPECDWGDGQSQLAAAGRLLYAMQPSQRRLLTLQLTGSTTTRSWFAPVPLPLGCRPRLLAYRRPADTLWTACDGGRVLRIVRASATGVAHRPVVWRVGNHRGDDRILRLPDSSSDLLVTLEGPGNDGSGLFLLVAVSVDDFGEGVGVERARLLVSGSIDRADVISQGGTLLLHSSHNVSHTPLVAVDLTTGRRIPFFSRFFSSSPTGRLVVSERRDRVLHLTGDTMYLYRVLPSGQLALSMHSSLDARPLDAQFQTGHDGTERLLATAQLPEGGLLTVSPGEATMRLVFDPHLRGMPHLSAPDYGSLAIAYSTDSAVFVNASSGVPAAATCPQSLFLGLQAVHWIWPE